ncbi:GntR family transcriptional regulator [Jonesia quinghaiensis]|uniref:GntR family transcriptional regulator n=1 Tax=Jonesia quinghaiensis TaxID=262806 RepID=UPI0009FF7821|nr:GntR family transcriptional regulator [Jonesia quinghaiensis]
MPHSSPRPGVSVFRVPRASTVDLIAIELRQAIFSGALPVGSPLGEVEISGQLGVSRSPLREAAQRLVQEGLLTATPGRGLRVSSIPPELVPDLYTARLAVEGQAIRIIHRDGDTQKHSELHEALDHLQSVSQGEDARKIGDADLDFHRTLVALAHSPRLSRAMETLIIETRIASYSMPQGYAVRRSVSPTYAALLEHLDSGNTQGALKALEDQFNDAVDRLTGRATHVDTVEPSLQADQPTLGPIEVLE